MKVVELLSLQIATTWPPEGVVITADRRPVGGAALVNAQGFAGGDGEILDGRCPCGVVDR